jgi:putative salt-induced outer membrane protein YdiY
MLIPLTLVAAGALALPAPFELPFVESAAPSADPFAPALYGAPLPAGWLSLQDAPAEPRGPQTGLLAKWDGAVNFGGSLSSGNTDVRAAQADALGVRENKDGDNLIDRWTAKGFWNYADQENALTGDRELVRRQAGASLKYDRTINERLYGYGDVSVQTDKLAGLKLRSTIGAGLGYQIYDEENFDLAGEAGLAYVDENYEGTASDTDFLAARLAYNLRWQIQEDLEFRQFAEAFPSLDDADDFFGRLDSRLVYLLSKSMTASLGHLWLFDNTPLAGRDRSDHIISLNVGWVF